MISQNITDSDIKRMFPDVIVSSPLKTGGQKQVFSVEHSKYGHCVFKIFSPDMELERVLKEISILQNASFPHVPKIYESKGVVTGGAECRVILEQRIDGQDLSKYHSLHSQCSIDFAIRLVDSMLDVIVALDRQKLVHRDIKPDNILIDENGEFWLIDFGAVRDLNEPTITATGVCAPLTAGYAAPEQYVAGMRKFLDSRADLFALGVTTYELLAGTHPFRKPGLGAYDVLVTTQQSHAQTLSIPGDIHGEFAGYIKSLMAKAPSNRPRTALAARKLFDGVLAMLVRGEGA